MATHCLLRLRFGAMFICLSGRHRSVPLRTRKDCRSREVSHASGERWLTETEWPQRLALHSDRSCRAVAVADLAAQSRWLSFRVVIREGIVRALCGQRRFHYSRAGIARPKLGHRTEKLGPRLRSDQSRGGRSVCAVRDRPQSARHRWILRRRIMRTLTRVGEWRRIQIDNRIFAGLYR
jgi:hypothetical protein